MSAASGRQHHWRCADLKEARALADACAQDALAAVALTLDAAASAI